MAISSAIDYALPYAVAYLGESTIAGAALTGLAHGYTGNYAYSDLIFGNAAMTSAERWSLAAGAVLSVLPSRAASKVVTNAGNIVKNRLSSYVAGEVTTKSMRAVTHLVEHTAQKCARNVITNTAKKTSEISARKGLCKFLKKEKDLIFPGKINLDTLSKAGQSIDRNGLTKAGRALQKHGGRPGSAFPKPSGNVTRMNQHGQDILDNILTHPDGAIHFRTHKQFGEIIDVKVPSVGGVRFTQSQEMIGLLEP